MSRTDKSNQSKPKTYKDQHRFEHWYRDNQTYFITAKTADATPVFTSDRACDLFWRAFDRACDIGSFTP